jgi:hypothetical protein
MADLVSSVVSTTLLCTFGALIMKICSLRDDLEEAKPEYYMLSKEEYDLMKWNAQHKYITEQPQSPLPPLPEYSEKDALLYEPPPLIPI